MLRGIVLENTRGLLSQLTEKANWTFNLPGHRSVDAWAPPVYNGTSTWGMG